jgi:hypothetical protein
MAEQDTAPATGAALVPQREQVVSFYDDKTLVLFRKGATLLFLGVLRLNDRWNEIARRRARP